MESGNHLCILITQRGWPGDSWENYNCNQSLVATLRNWDNTPTESWFGSFKNERVHGERFGTRDEMKAMAFEYIEVFYNRKRLHSTLGYQSPVQFMQDWISTQSMER